MLSVFISYASEDKKRARDLAFQLGEDGFDPWMDEKKLLPGHDWRIEIEQAIERSHVALICLSNASVEKRGFVQKEIKKILDVSDEFPEGEIFLIPLLLERCPVPHSLRKKNWVEIFKADGYEKLRNVLRLRASELGIDLRPPSKSGDLVGVYLATGNNDDGTPYEGKVLISKLANTYQVTWRIGEDHFQAEGTLKGNRLCVTGDFNFEYEIKLDGILFGEWEPGATEKLIRIPPDFNW